MCKHSVRAEHLNCPVHIACALYRPEFGYPYGLRQSGRRLGPVWYRLRDVPFVLWPCIIFRPTPETRLSRYSLARLVTRQSVAAFSRGLPDYSFLLRPLRLVFHQGVQPNDFCQVFLQQRRVTRPNVPSN